MDTKEYYQQCEKCGRRFPPAVPTCPCSNVDKEYAYKTPGCIRIKKPECPYNAVIASVTVDHADEMKCLADCFVHVTDNNTTYYIDDKHRIMTVWAGPVELTDYDIDANELKLRSQWLYNIANESGAKTVSMVYFNKQGEPTVVFTEEVS